jgi:4-hydroxy-tetrahydrodipicolinate synthase
VTPTALRGVIAAIPTPFDADLAPDTARLLRLAERLLTHCDGLNLCGTTGEATSMSVAQRRRVMEAAASGLPRARLMVGTGAAAIEDAAELTRHAGRLGFAGALLLPPFYYKGVASEGVVEAVRRAAGDTDIPIYLYNFPQMTGIAYAPDTVARLHGALGGRLRGLKDSSNDLPYARAVAAISPDLDVFPSDEAVLPLVRAGDFAGCISATANVSAALCARVRDGESGAAQDAMIAVRRTLAQGPLVSRVKACVAGLMADDAYARALPPLPTLAADEGAALWREVSHLLDRARGAAR